MVVIETTRVVLFTQHAPYLSLVFPQPLFLFCDCDNILLSVAILAQESVILSFVRAISTILAACATRIC